MNIIRDGLRTGVLVVITVAALVAVLVYLGAPGAFTPQKQFGIYFDNAAGIRLGTPVMLAGRKVGQVVEIVSPVPLDERPLPATEKDPPLEVRVTVKMAKSAKVYRVTKVRLASYGFLDEPVIDFTGGEESSGLAEETMHFVGERPGGLADTGTQILEKIDPVVNQLVITLKSLDSTASNVTQLTDPQADLAQTFSEFRALGKNLADLSGPDGPLRRALTGLENLTDDDGKLAAAVEDFRKLIAPDSELAKALANAEKFTAQLANTNDIPATLKNFRAASTQLNSTLGGLKDDLGAAARNLEQGTDTLKRQPWRLLWPSTKKYPEENAAQVQAPPRGRSGRADEAKPVERPKRALFRESRWSPSAQMRP